MKVCGFTFVRNAVKFGYPAIQSIKSILPVCDKLIVSVGNSEDETLTLIQSIDSQKIEIIHSVWDDSKREGGEVLAIETNKAFDAISKEYDWCFYLQADEVVHEKYHDSILRTMRNQLSDKNVDGLLFHYTHFYGTYDYIGDSRSWYRNEIRIIRNDKSIRSYKDAQGFRKNGQKLRVKRVEAYVYHYGWVKPPSVMMEKQKSFNKLWHDDNWVKENVGESELFDYSQIDSLDLFKGTHPDVMKELIENVNWKIEIDTAKNRMKMKDRVLNRWEKLTGMRPFEYKNYKLI